MVNNRPKVGLNQRTGADTQDMYKDKDKDKDSTKKGQGQVHASFKIKCSENVSRVPFVT